MLNREEGSDGNRDQESDSCDEYVYEGDEASADGEYPWDLHIRNISLPDHPVRITVTNVAGESPQRVAYCEATSENHSELDFDLSDATSYRVEVTMNDQEASTSVAGPLDENEALEVTVENGEFQIRHVHYDEPKTPA